MKEIIEVRLSADKAGRFLPLDVGEDLGLLRRLELRSDDPLLEKIREYERRERERGATMIPYWDIHRQYTRRELDEAELLLLNVRPLIEPAGRDSGTMYEESEACPRCGMGARQVGPLRLEEKRIPRRDIVQTVGGELLVSARLAEQMASAGIRGHELGSVVGRTGKPVEGWFQLRLPDCTVDLSTRTQAGRSYFAPEPDPARCLGHVVGARILSEVFVERRSVDDLDWHCSRLARGEKLGSFRPLSLVFISPRLYRLLVDMKAKRFDVEVAHLASRV